MARVVGPNYIPLLLYSPQRGPVDTLGPYSLAMAHGKYLLTSLIIYASIDQK